MNKLNPDSSMPDQQQQDGDMRRKNNDQRKKGGHDDGTRQMGQGDPKRSQRPDRQDDSDQNQHR